MRGNVWRMKRAIRKLRKDIYLISNSQLFFPLHKPHILDCPGKTMLEGNPFALYAQRIGEFSCFCCATWSRFLSNWNVCRTPRRNNVCVAVLSYGIPISSVTPCISKIHKNILDQYSMIWFFSTLLYSIYWIIENVLS